MMRKRLLLTFVSVATVMATFSQTQKAVTVPYSSDLGIPKSATSTGTGNIDPAWTSVDADDLKQTDGETTVNQWAYNYNSAMKEISNGGVSITVKQFAATLDWLISPAISLEAGKTYKFSWYTYSKAAGITYTTRIAPDITDYDADTYTESLVSGLDAGISAGNVTTVANSLIQSEYMFIPETTGDYRFGFCENGKTATKGGTLFLTKFEIVEDGESPEIPDEKITPGAITDFTATPVGTELEVSLSWTLPTTDANGKTIEPSAIKEVKLWRGEELIATLAGTATSYTDQVPAAGFYTYKVAAVSDEEGEAVSVITSYVGEKKPYAIPYTADFTNADMTKAFWTTIDANKDGKGWKYDDSGFTFDNYSSAIIEDDWLITPALSFDRDGTYRITWKGRCADGSLLFVIGNENTVAGMTGDNGTAIGIVELSGYSTVEKKIDFKVTIPGTYYIGIKCDKDPSGGQPYFTNAFSVTEVSEEDHYQTITIPEEGSMVFSSKDALGFGEVEGLSAYIATVADNMLSIEEVESVPASTGVILKGEAGEYKVPYISTADAVEGNVIVATVAAQSVSAGAYIYRDGTKGVGFYKVGATTEIPAGSGYLPASTGEVSFISENGGSTVKLTETIIVGEDGSMTYSLNRGLDFSSAQGITAYIIDKVEEDSYSCKEIEKVPASTGILIKAEPGEYEVAYCDDAEAVSGNQLRAAINGVPVTEGAFIYKNGTEGIGFYKLAEGMTMPDNTAYLPSYASMSDFLREGNTSSITGSLTDDSKRKSVYDLNGRRIANPDRGIYVINGKTVMIK